MKNRSDCRRCGEVNCVCSNRVRAAGIMSIALLAMMAIFGCSAGSQEQVTSDSQDLYALGSCTTDAQCQTYLWTQVGWCSDPSAAVCNSNHSCSFPVNTANTSCVCINGEERDCAGGGRQSCFISGSGTAWTTCDTSTTPTYHAYPSCSGISDCQSYSYIPACTDYNNIGCNQHQCIWQPASLSDEPDCACVEHEVQDCTKPGNIPGHQYCYLVTGTSSSNDWGHPTAWSTCG